MEKIDLNEYLASNEYPGRGIAVAMAPDGRQMFIKLPPAVQSGDAPVVLGRNSGQDTLANFRMKNLTLLVDGVFPEAKLIPGVGSHQQRITIRKLK